MYTLIGFRKFVSKKGSKCCVVTLTSDFSSFEMEHGAYGSKSEEVFLPEDCHPLINPSVIGSSCELTYGAGLFGKPAITGIVFHQKK